MSFDFALDGLLRVRQNTEKAEELLFSNITQEIVMADAQIKQLESRQIELRRKLEQQLQFGLPAFEVWQAGLQELELKQACEALRAKLAGLHQDREAQLSKLQEAQRACEVVRRLRDESYQEYQQQEMRAEQKQLDDLFLSRQRKAK